MDKLLARYLADFNRDRNYWDRDEPGILSTLHVILAWGICLGIIYVWLR